MADLASSPAFNAAVIVGWAIVAGAAAYRHLATDWSRLRAVLFVALAAGWIAQSVGDAAPLVGIGPPITDWLFVGFSGLFVGGVGYALVLYRRTAG